MGARHTHRLKNGSEGVRALGQLREAVLHEAESNDQAERNGSPASYYKSTRQLQRKSTRYLHTQHLKRQRFTYESGRGWSRILQATIAPPRAAPTFLSKNMPSELENAGKSPSLVSQPGGESKNESVFRNKTSTTPSRMESCWTVKKRYVQLIDALWAMSGCRRSPARTCRQQSSPNLLIPLAK